MGVPLEIDLLGKFRLRYRGEAVSEMNSPRLQELLAYLVLNRDSPQQRQHIALNFWPDSPAKQTLSNLRQLLYQLRNALPESDRYIRADSNTLQWNPEDECRIDLVEFEQAVDEARRRKNGDDAGGEIDALEQAVSVYDGPLLPHCFEEWITGKRHRLQEEYADALERLIELYEEQRKYKKGIVYAGKLVEQNPTDESAARRLMQLYAFNDDRASVVRTYRELQKRMKEELDIEPGRETSELFRRLTEEYKAGQEARESGRDLDRNRDDAAPVTVSTLEEDWPMIGRNEEWKRLAGAWKKVRTGVMQSVVIRGEPGIGKSRLGREFLIHLARQGYQVAWARCHEAPGTPGYGPVAKWLRSKPFQSRIRQLDPVWQNEIGRLLPELSVDREDAETEVNEPVPEKEEREPWLQTRFEEALARALLEGGKPAAVMLDGLQWCDPETLGWFNNLLHRGRPVPLLLVATLRTPVETTVAPDALESMLLTLRRNHCLRKIELEPLDHDHTVELASLILDREINKSLGSLIYKDTEGNPLFIVETAREIHQLEELKKREREEDDFVPPDETRSRLRSLPGVVSDVISDRFRYLSSGAKYVLGIASVAGRGFSFVHIRRCCDLEIPELVDALDELVDRHILRELDPEWYDFSHDKLREVAYKMLSETRKRSLHRSMVEALPEIEGDNPARLHRRMAFHCERAGDTGQAVEHYRLSARYAGGGNIGMLRRAMELLNKIPEGEERDMQELDITKTLALALLQRKNFDREEVFRLCKRVHQLCSKLGEPPPVAILMALGIASLWTGDPGAAVELGTVMHTLSSESDAYRGYTEACYLLGVSNRHLGHIGKSAEWCKKGLEYYDYSEASGQPFVHLQAYDLDGSILLRMETACALLLSGKESEGRDLMERTLEVARETNRTADLACAWFKTAWLETLLRNASGAQDAVKQFLMVEFDVEPLYWTVQSDIIQGWTMTAQKEDTSERGMDRIRRGLERLEKDNRVTGLPLYYGLFGEVLAEAEHFDEARTVLDRAAEIMDSTGAKFAEAEIRRAEGALLMAEPPGDPERAGEAFSKALETARRQGCGLFEDRAAAAMDRIG